MGITSKWKDSTYLDIINHQGMVINADSMMASVVKRFSLFFFSNGMK